MLSYITPQSRILFNRNINERISRIAPFLLFDSDPYYEKALQMQRQGDWAGYGEQIRELGQILNKMAK